MIRSVFDYIESKSCVRFIPGYLISPIYIGERHYLKIRTNVSYCIGSVGYCYLEGQRLDFAPYCMEKAGIIHETLHSLGFYHQHNAPNRDQYIKVHLENVLSQFLTQFSKYSPQDVTDHGVPYDHKSIMHYDARLASKNENRTMTAKDEKLTDLLGNAKEMSPSDIVVLNRMYKCTAYLKGK